MSEMRNREPLGIRQTARGIAIRAGLLGAAVLVAGVWILSMIGDVIGGAIKLLVGLVLAVIVGAWAMVKIRRFRRRP